jgi:hypothetical protein
MKWTCRPPGLASRPKRCAQVYEIEAYAAPDDGAIVRAALKIVRAAQGSSVTGLNPQISKRCSGLVDVSVVPCWLLMTTSNLLALPELETAKLPGRTQVPLGHDEHQAHAASTDARMLEPVIGGALASGPRHANIVRCYEVFGRARCISCQGMASTA